MRIARFSTGGDPRYGIVDDDELVVLKGDPMFSGYDTTGERVPLAEVRLLAPVIPRSKIVGVGRNWADHAKELGNEVPASPQFFLKPNTAVVGPNGLRILVSGGWASASSQSIWLNSVHGDMVTRKIDWRWDGPPA